MLFSSITMTILYSFGLNLLQTQNVRTDMETDVELRYASIVFLLIR